jgi:hypothetical protein
MITRSNTVSVGARHRQQLEASHIPNPSPPPRADHARPDKQLDTTYRQLGSGWFGRVFGVFVATDPRLYTAAVTTTRAAAHLLHWSTSNS